MLIGKKRKLGRKINEIQTGEKLEYTETIEDKDLLLYLGLTNDNNPLFIQHDYASLTPYKKPIVPQVMIFGMITSAVSKYLPGPGSSVLHTNLSFPHPVYHYEKLSFFLEVKDVHKEKHIITVSVKVESSDGKTVCEGLLDVCPPYAPKSITTRTMENF